MGPWSQKWLEEWCVLTCVMQVLITVLVIFRTMRPQKENHHTEGKVSGNRESSLDIYAQLLKTSPDSDTIFQFSLIPGGFQFLKSGQLLDATCEYLPGRIIFWKIVKQLQNHPARQKPSPPLDRDGSYGRGEVVPATHPGSLGEPVSSFWLEATSILPLLQLCIM